jgi:hypothetical protein
MAFSTAQAPNNIAGFPYGYVFSLRLPVNACTSAVCSWNESLVYGFSGAADGGTPLYGDLTFDQAGNHVRDDLRRWQRQGRGLRNDAFG